VEGISDSPMRIAPAAARSLLNELKVASGFRVDRSGLKSLYSFFVI